MSVLLYVSIFFYFIFASANNKFVLIKVINSFNLLHPDIKVITEYGSTGDLANFILEGVDYDIFLGANMDIPKKNI